MTIALATVALWLLVLGLARPAIRLADLIPEEMGFRFLWRLGCMFLSAIGAFIATVWVPLPEGAPIILAAAALGIEVTTFIAYFNLRPPLYRWFPIGRLGIEQLQRRKRLRNKRREPESREDA
jgi:hypothetical protein